MVTARELIRVGRRRLLDEAERLNRTGDEAIQALELLEHAAGRVVDEDDEVDPRTRRRFEAYIERRALGEPVPYIRGYEEFWGLRFTVRPGAFIPRQTTEFLARQAVRRLQRRKAPLAADLATGVGAVAVVIGHEVPDATVFGTDISQEALRLARTNARANGTSNVRFLAGSMFEPLPKRLQGHFDVIASHPPYIPTEELDGLPSEMIEYEPIHSLTDSSPDGLGLARVLIAGARRWLKPGGWLCIEIAPDMARAVRTMLVRAAYREVESTKGSPHTRVLVAKR